MENNWKGIIIQEEILFMLFRWQKLQKFCVYTNGNVTVETRKLMMEEREVEELLN